MKRFIFLLAIVLLVGCEAKDVWTPEVCNDMFAVTLRQIEEQKQLAEKMRKTMEEAQRKGDTKLFETQKKIYDSHMKDGLGGSIKYIEEQVLKNCDRGVLKLDFFSGLDAAKKLLNVQEKTFKEEGMPDIQVTAVESTFIPYELNEQGSCSGPYLDLKFTVLNRGGDFPRPVDLENYEKRTQLPADKLTFFEFTGELNFGEDSRHSIHMEIKGGSGARIPSGGSLKIPAKIQLRNDQTFAHVTANIRAMQLLANANNGLAYETDIEVPLWDIYTENHMAVVSKDEDGKTNLLAMAIVTNKGKTPTPGPIRGSFTINDLETGRYVTSWSGQTQGPVSGGGRIIYKEPYSGKLPDKAKIQSSIMLRCPDGNGGDLADGNSKNNNRELSPQGSTQEAQKAAAEMLQQWQGN